MNRSTKLEDQVEAPSPSPERSRTPGLWQPLQFMVARPLVCSFYSICPDTSRKTHQSSSADCISCLPSRTASLATGVFSVAGKDIGLRTLRLDSAVATPWPVTFRALCTVDMSPPTHRTLTSQSQDFSFLSPSFSFFSCFPSFLSPSCYSSPSSSLLLFLLLPSSFLPSLPLPPPLPYPLTVFINIDLEKQSSFDADSRQFLPLCFSYHTTLKSPRERKSSTQKPKACLPAHERERQNACHSFAGGFTTIEVETHAPTFSVIPLPHDCYCC